MTDHPRRVTRALLSVSDKSGLIKFARALAGHGIDLVSTGGTASALREAGIAVTDVSEFTGQEEILDGRVKTLHPRLHAALLARRDDAEHMATLEGEGIEPIDIVCVNLYPFEQTIARDDVDERTAIENIELPMSLAGRNGNKEWVDRIVDTVGLRSRLSHRPSELSGGQQQRVAVARALASQPQIIFADEPTGNLDSKNGEAVMQLLDELHKAGSTICMVTHDPRYADFAERKIFMFDGRVVDEATRHR